MASPGQVGRHQRGLNELPMSSTFLRFIVIIALCAGTPISVAHGQSIETLIAEAKAEKELFFIAGPTTFGGKKGLSDIEATFGKRFGLDAKIRLSAGPVMYAMA